MARGEALYLQDMIDSADIVARFVAGKTLDDLTNDILLQDGLVRRLEILGEAATRLSRPLKERHPSIAWADIVGFRNYAIHAYFSVDLSIVWATAVEDVPLLGPSLAWSWLGSFPRSRGDFGTRA